MTLTVTNRQIRHADNILQQYDLSQSSEVTQTEAANKQKKNEKSADDWAHIGD